MRIQIASDLHNEFGISELDFSNVDLLILAGDINLGKKGLLWIKEQVRNIPVIYVLGNHEYYKHAYPKLLDQLKEATINTNIHILEKNSITIDDITFHGTTLWTNFELFGDPKIAGMEAQPKMTDYKHIRRHPEYIKLRTVDTYVMHYDSLYWLKESLLSSNTCYNVVITHHAPSILSIPHNQRDKLISAAYASHLDSFILEMKPQLWIHGHIHNFLDYTIGNTRIICNPRGYPDEPCTNFNNKFVVEF